ncbi:MAG: winged helix DNA-binding domain-containing protein [Anaerolineae bacterium]|nr:winged helix DNA-binding domain-containing protein [Anaerolineae bacterium]
MPARSGDDGEPAAATLTWEQVLAWRMRRQHLDRRAPRGEMLAVAGDICGLHAQLMSSAELALWARVADLEGGAMQRALWQDRALVKAWAMRGTLHLLPSAEYPTWQAALSTYRHPERGYWQRYFGVTPEQLERLLEVIPLALDGPPLTREELADAVASLTGSPELGSRLRGGWGSLLKPASYLGYLCFADSVGNNVRFTRPDRWLPAWHPQDPAGALGAVFRRYLGAKGPATEADLVRWWTGISTARARHLLKGLGEQVVPVSIEGTSAWALVENLPDLLAAGPTGAVRLVPAFDQYVIGAAPDAPELLLPPAMRARVYRPQAWISPVLLADGRMEATWRHERKRSQVSVTIEPFRPLPPWVRQGAEREAESLAHFLGGRLELTWAS